MRVVALLAIRNEERYLSRCLEHLFDQGIETCVIDNGSTDRSLEIANSYLGRGVFRIEHLPFRGKFELYSQLRKKERLASEIEADWFFHQGADEIREASLPYKTLLEGIEEVDRQGYNDINFDEFVFLPTSDDESYEGTDYVNEMRYYYYFAPWPLRQVNLWKKMEASINLTDSAGHRVSYDGQKIFPEPFILRHYILLSKAHALEKYGKRIHSEDGIRRGWHGARLHFSENKLNFPKRERLKKVANDNVWDRSEPWKEHEFFGVSNSGNTHEKRTLLLLIKRYLVKVIQRFTNIK